MGLEAATYISGLVPANPLTNDKKKQGDDHLRLIKTVLQSTFPNASRAFRLPETEAMAVDEVVAAADENRTYYVDCTGGARTFTLPAVASIFAGWECSFVKIDATTNPIFIQPAAGTLRSGDQTALAKTRRCIPNVRFKAFYTGTVWVVDRCIQLPIGSVLDCPRSGLPVGFEYANAVALSSALNYPDYNAVMGGLATPDRRSVVAVGIEGMAGAADSTRLDTNTVVGSIQGSKVHTLVEAEMPVHNHGITDPGHFHTSNSGPSATQGTSVGVGIPYHGQVAQNSNVKTTGITINNKGGGGSHANVQPTVGTRMIVVVE